MKSLNKLSFLATTVLLLVFASCSKQLDDIRPKNAIPQDALTDADIAKLRIGMYSQMENMLFSFYFDFDVRGENFKEGPGFSLIDPVNMDASNATITSLWQNAYTTLNKVNFLIETIDNSASASTYSTMKGEALYFRALIYYNLVTRWGGVPILTKSTYAVVPRASEDETWTQIKTDLTTAETLTGAFSDKFYVSKMAVDALLAKVYLATGDNANAITYADKVLSSSTGFTLAADSIAYANMFVYGNTSKELIFALANNTSSNIHAFYSQVNDVDPTWNYSPVSALFTSLYADKSIAQGDKRKAAVFSVDNSRIIKYPNGVAGQQLIATTSPNYTPIIVSRIAEIYLIKAEAQGAGAAAEATLQPYFTARYKIIPSSGTISALSAKDFQDMILDENRREFFGEGHRWYDLKRTGRKDLLTTLAGRTYLLYYPIPQTEKDLAGYTQNDGY